ncbi:cupin domain-containing protein [Ferrovibrio sp.]|uniref:cupin domain-containing protein n=1 Tax=Ferrovibrio sp. TaxID=1917215 RepID=UPI0035B3572D
MTADEIIAALGLQPHPEGGHYVETFRDAPGPDGRSRSTAIYFLLRAGERSHWHRVDAVEIWHFHAGAPLRLSISEGHGRPIQQITLGHGVIDGQRPQGIVPPHHWQAAESLGEWTLVGCTVAPGFDFAGFELAPPGWAP